MTRNVHAIYLSYGSFNQNTDGPKLIISEKYRLHYAETIVVDRCDASVMRDV